MARTESAETATHAAFARQLYLLQTKQPERFVLLRAHLRKRANKEWVRALVQLIRWSKGVYVDEERAGR